MSRIEIDPVPAPRMTRSDRWAKRPCVMRSFEFRNKLFQAYGKTLPVPCRLIFTIAMPQGWSEKKKLAMDGKPHCARPDIDNLSKNIFDSLLKEDSHVWKFEAAKYWGRKGSIEIE